jgi:peptide/nickel transport system substrate-binding protein
MRRGLSLCVLLLSASILGCSRPDQAANVANSAGPPADGDWAIVQYGNEPDSLNPHLSTNASAQYVLYGVNSSNVYETFLQFDRSNKWAFTKPLLAESYPEISPDHLVYTFTLRDGIKWHDGKPLTVDDVLFSAKAAVCPGVDDAPLRTSITDLADVEVVEGRKVRYTVRKPYFLNDFALGTFPVIPKHVFDPDGLLDKFTVPALLSDNARSNENVKKFADAFNKHPANRAPVGTGPYKVEKWDTSKEIVLVRNEGYWAMKPHLDRIIVRIIQDTTAALTALKAGEVDLVPRLSGIQYAQQTSGGVFDQQFTKAKYRYPSYGFIVWNTEKPIFKDKRVRQALTMLVPRQLIIDKVRFGLATPATGPVSPESYDYNPNIKPWPYDPARAAQLLDEAGWKDSNGDGVRDKDGMPFRFEFTGTAQNQFMDQLLPILKDEFRKVGIDMTERRVEFTVQVDSLKDHKFDASSLNLLAQLLTDPYSVWHSSQIKNRGQNYSSFKNPEIDHILEQARTEFDREKRQQLYWRFQEIIHDEQPFTFIFYPTEAAAFHKRFQNVNWLPSIPGYDLTEWFVPKAMQKYAVAPAQ